MMTQGISIMLSKNSYIIAETSFLKALHMQEDNSKSNEFYANCMAYFEALRKTGKQDFGFEDEFFYTMPAISETVVNDN